MGSFIAKQPNGLYCRYSSTVDGLTHINMTLDDYIKYLMKRNGMSSKEAYYEAVDTIENYIQPFDLVIENFNFWENTREKLLGEIIKMTTDGASYEQPKSDYPEWSVEDHNEYEENPTKYETEFDNIREEARKIVANYYYERGIEYSQINGRGR